MRGCEFWGENVIRIRRYRRRKKELKFSCIYYLSVIMFFIYRLIFIRTNGIIVYWGFEIKCLEGLDK